MRPGPGMARTALVLAVLVAGSRLPLRAKDLNGFFDFTFARFDTNEEFADLPTQETSNEVFNRRLYFNYGRQAYPRLRFWIGGTFDSNDRTRDFAGDVSEADEWRLRPVVGVVQRSDRWTTQLLWSRDHQRLESTDFEPLETIRDSITASTNYRPRSEFGPMVQVALSTRRDRDAEEQYQDTQRSSIDVGVRHQIDPRLRWTYRGSVYATEDNLSGTETRNGVHRAEVSYSNQWLDRRVTLGSRYSINYRESSVSSPSGGEIDVPVFPLEGLAARDDTPLVGALPPEPGLIDDDLTTPTPVNLGLPAPGGDERAWNIGLDIGQTATIDAMLVWVDRDLPREIASSFVWQVYSSPNNLDWTLRESLAAAPFDTFLRRFRIRFPELRERFVKLVVRPLGLDVPEASQYPDIFITELDGLQVVSAASGRSESSDTFQRALLYTRVRLLAEEELYYEGNIDAALGRDRELAYNMTHGVYYGTALSPEADLTSRVSWQDTDTGRTRSSDFVYSAALNVRPVDRLSYTLSLTGTKPDSIGEANADRINLFFFGTAGLYEGVDLQLGVGRTWVEAPLGGTLVSTRAEFGARIQPRRDLIFLLNYTDAVSELDRRESTGLFGEVFTRLALANATYTPVPSLYLFAQYRVEWREEREPVTYRRTSATWTPFPQAAFRLGVNYDETRSDPNIQSTRTVGPYLRWTFNPLSFVQVAYTDISENSVQRRYANQVFSATLRWGF